MDSQVTISSTAGPRPFLRRAALLMAVRVYGVGMTFVVTLLLARGLGAEGYGRYAFLFAVVTLAALPTQFGLPDLVVRETSRALAHGSKGLLAPLWRWAHGFIAVSSALVIAVVWAATWRLQATPEATALALALLLIPLIALSNLRAAILRGLGHDLLGQLPEHAIRPTLFAAGLLALWLLPSGSASVTGAFAVQAAAVGLATIFGLVLMRRLAPRVPPVPPGRTAQRGWYRAALFMGSISGLILVNSSVDIIMLGIWSSDTAVGQYRLAAMVGALITLGLQTMNLYAMPHLTRFLGTGDTGGLARLVRQTTQISFGFSLAALAALLLLGEPALVWVFGADFAAAFPVLLVLAGGHIANAFFGPARALMMMAGDERLAAGLTAIGTVANVGLNLALIPRFGGLGAAVATSVSVAVVKAIAFGIVWRRHGVLSWPLPDLGTRTR